MHPRLEQLTQYLDAQRDALMAAASRVPLERWADRPAPDRWSMADLFEHLALVEHGSARVVAKSAAEARAKGHPAESDTTPLDETFAHVGLMDRTQKRQAPDRVVPTGKMTGADARDALIRTRRELKEAMQIADGLALRTIMFPHPRLGDISLYQWVLFVAQHEERHVPQASEIADQLLLASR